MHGGKQIGVFLVKFFCDVELSAEFGRGSLADTKEANKIAIAVAFAAFGDVGRNGKRGALDLAFKTKLFQELVSAKTSTARRHPRCQTSRSSKVCSAILQS